MAAKVVFPPPPPTTNDLTAQQRTQLVRSSRKIEQILGTAPRFIDTSIAPIHVTLPYGSLQRRWTKTRRSSVDSTSSVSSSESQPPPKYVQRSASLSGNFSGMRKSMLGSHRSSQSSSSIALESWVQDKTVPGLRLAVESLTLDTIPASPDPTCTSFMETAPQSPLNSLSNFNPEDASSSFTHSPQETPSPRNSLALPPVTIPSPNSLRKQKMDRLRKKLGHDVPLELVFPKENDVARSENIPSHAFPVNLEKECPPLPPPSPRPVTKRTARRIASSRDSISGIATIHRAKRQNHTSPTGNPADGSMKESRVKERLSFIVESPDEHGSGCSEEFGLSRVSTNETDMSGWVLKSHNTEIKFWSTRKGYEGWSPVSTASFPNLSSSSLSSSDDSTEPVSPASTSTTSPDSVETSPTVEVRRRLSSYRKPPPPVPADCY
ncbi:hypothetical protein CPB84DRAFT_1847145 [Gymnopilus junonius]|uniref:Uncharacterized protein n=1 Tax=Gymnopilus junonius TaxID=109634 RepID=A0A9P5TM85_GYMJU|nr:hypothetical protein CPB84DRAFT_1847145 [Gymnopilus junonius]